MFRTFLENKTIINIPIHQGSDFLFTNPQNTLDILCFVLDCEVQDIIVHDKNAEEEPK